MARETFKYVLILQRSDSATVVPFTSTAEHLEKIIATKHEGVCRTLCQLLGSGTGTFEPEQGDRLTVQAFSDETNTLVPLDVLKLVYLAQIPELAAQSHEPKVGKGK